MPGQTHQPDEAKASVLVDKDLRRFAILREELLHILLCGSSRQVSHKQPAPLCVGLLSWLPEVLQVYSESIICRRESSVNWNHFNINPNIYANYKDLWPCVNATQSTTVAYLGYSALQHQCAVHCCRFLRASSAALVGGWAAAVGVGRDSAALNVVLCFLASIKAQETSIQTFKEDGFQNLRKILIQKCKQSNDGCCSVDVRGFTDIAVSFNYTFSEMLNGKIYVGHTM